MKSDGKQSVERLSETLRRLNGRTPFFTVLAAWIEERVVSADAPERRHCIPAIVRSVQSLLRLAAARAQHPSAVPEDFEGVEVVAMPAEAERDFTGFIPAAEEPSKGGKAPRWLAVRGPRGALAALEIQERPERGELAVLAIQLCGEAREPGSPAGSLALNAVAADLIARVRASDDLCEVRYGTPEGA